MPRPRPPYPEEFRREAVELVRSSGLSISQVARDLGCSANALRIWVHRYEVDAGRRDALRTEEREELRKATAFFAKESGTR